MHFVRHNQLDNMPNELRYCYLRLESIVQSLALSHDTTRRQLRVPFCLTQLQHIIAPSGSRRGTRSDKVINKWCSNPEKLVLLLLCMQQIHFMFFFPQCKANTEKRKKLQGQFQSWNARKKQYSFKMQSVYLHIYMLNIEFSFREKLSFAITHIT